MSDRRLRKPGDKYACNREIEQQGGERCGLFWGDGDPPRLEYPRER